MNTILQSLIRGPFLNLLSDEVNNLVNAFSAYVLQIQLILTMIFLIFKRFRLQKYNLILNMENNEISWDLLDKFKNPVNTEILVSPLNKQEYLTTILKMNEKEELNEADLNLLVEIYNRSIKSISDIILALSTRIYSVLVNTLLINYISPLVLYLGCLFLVCVLSYLFLRKYMTTILWILFFLFVLWGFNLIDKSALQNFYILGTSFFTKIAGSFAERAWT